MSKQITIILDVQRNTYIFFCLQTTFFISKKVTEKTGLFIEIKKFCTFLGYIMCSDNVVEPFRCWYLVPYGGS